MELSDWFTRCVTRPLKEGFVSSSEGLSVGGAADGPRRKTVKATAMRSCRVDRWLQNFFTQFFPPLYLSLSHILAFDVFFFCPFFFFLSFSCYFLTLSRHAAIFICVFILLFLFFFLSCFFSLVVPVFNPFLCVFSLFFFVAVMSGLDAMRSIPGPLALSPPSSGGMLNYMQR